MSYKDYELKNDIEELEENSIKYQPVLNTKELNYCHNSIHLI